MTDDATELRPARQWPPASVWLLVVPMFGPAAVLLGRTVWIREPRLVWGIAICLLMGSLLAVPILRGRSSGMRTLDAILKFVGVIFALVTVLEATTGRLHSAARGLIPLVWVAVVASLRMWPETRRWCGELPPTDPDDDA